MNQSEKQAIKALVQGGGLRLIETVADEVKSEMSEVKYSENPYELAYRHGKRDGAIENLNYLIHKLKQTADES